MARDSATSAVNPLRRLVAAVVGSVYRVNRASGNTDKSSRGSDQLQRTTTSVNNELRGFQFARTNCLRPPHRSIGKFRSVSVVERSAVRRHLLSRYSSLVFDR